MAITGNLLSANAESIETDASAWSALVNASGLARGNGGTLGSFCLLFKSVAAGDCQVGLAANVTVTSGQEYWSCASVFPPAAGTQFRLEIRFYRANGTLSATTQGPLVTATGGAWQQAAAIGTAPSDATQAQVVIRVTATAATQSWYADRVFLGPTTPSPGNLLPFGTETVETDVSGWTATSLCTIGLSNASYTWYQSLLLTSTGAGSCTVQTVSAPAVTPGTEYAAYAYVTPGTAGLTQQIRIQWLDGSGATVGTSSANWTPPTGQWTRVTVVDKAPAGAVSARLVLAPQATATGQVWAYDRMVLAPTSVLMTAGSMLGFNAYSIEQDISGWTVTGGTATQTREQILSDAYSMKMVATGGDMAVTLVTPVPVAESIGYQFAPCLYTTSAGTAYRTQLEWLDSSGTTMRTRWQSWNTVTGAWRQGSMGDLAPAGATSLRVSVVIPSASAGDVWYMDRIELKPGGLTALAVPAAGGGALITLRGLTTGGPTWKWSLDRVISGQAPQPVRGYAGDLTSQTITGDVAVVTDYEVPLGTPVQWRVRITGTGSFTYLSDPVVLDASGTEVWLTDPGLPQRSVAVTVAPPMPTWTRPARQSTSAVRGRALPVVISDVRGGKTGDLTVVTETAEDRDALWWVLDAGSTLLLRWPPGWGEDDMYVQVGDVQVAPVVPEYAEFQDRTFVLPLTQVDRPIGGVTGSADRTWQTVKDSGSTWTDALAGSSSWLVVRVGS